MLIDTFKDYFYDEIRNISGTGKVILILYKEQIIYTLDKKYDEVWFIDCLNYICLKDFMCLISNIQKYKLMQAIELNNINNPTLITYERMDNLLGIPGIKKWEASINTWVYYSSSI